MDSKTELNAIQIVRNVLDNNGRVRHCMNCGENIKEGKIPILSYRVTHRGLLIEVKK